MPVLKVEDFPEDLKREARSQASLDGGTLRGLVIEAVEREVERRKQVRAERRASDR